MKKLILLVLLIIPVVSFSQFKKYDKELNCKLLYDIGFDVSDIKFKKDTTVTFYGESLNAKSFSIKAKITIQTACYVVSGEFEDAYAYFDFIVAHDSSYTIRDNFLKAIYNYWKSKDDGYRENYSSLPCDLGIYYQNGDYMLYEDNGSYIFWFNKRIILIKAVSLEEGKSGWWGAHCLLKRLAFYDFFGNRFSMGHDFPPNDFIILYNGGKFNQRRWIDEYYEKQ